MSSEPTAAAPSASPAAAEPSNPNQQMYVSKASDGTLPNPTITSNPSPPSTVVLRFPSSHTVSSAADPSKSKPTYPPPSPSWLQGTWHVTHSTLAMWKGKANVRITYTPMPESHPAGETKGDGRADMPDLDDLVEYQKQGKNKISSIHGISRCVMVADSGLAEKGWAFAWRGRGWLMIASTHWEVLGWGRDAESGRDWAVTYFGKTLFTPAGIDVYCKDGAGVSVRCLEEIKRALSEVEHLKGLAETLFDIPRE